MPEPAISVAMSVYNGARYLPLAIESILAQSFTGFEFLILNDGSTDESGAIIDSYAANDSRIRAIHRENKGLIVSLNQLLAESRAPLVARMDADDIALPERFAAQIRFMEANPDHGVVSCQTLDIDANGDPDPSDTRIQPESHEAFLAAINNGSPLVCHPSTMLRRDLVLGVGGYHAAFKHCEDYDLWLRLASITRICSIPERLMKYRHYPDQVSSRHIVEQQINAAVAFYAWQERQAGRADPTEGLSAMPPLDQIDALFGRSGVAASVLARAVPNFLYSPIALRADGFELMLRHVQNGGNRTGLKRTVARLVRLGEPTRALKLAGALARAA